MNLEDLVITKECCDWLTPIVKDLPETSYEQSATDAVINHVMKLEKKLALAEGEWKTYATSCESLSKKLAEANEMLTSSGIDELQNKLKVAVSEFNEISKIRRKDGKEPYAI